jgi:O-antigen ligase
MYSGGALGGALQRSAIASDARFSFWPLVVSAAGQFQPFGSGIGTFVPAYQMFEPRSALAPLFVIHAHNDYLELALEAGFPGIALCLVGIVWLGFAGFRALSGFSRFGAERGYAVTILAAIALHSLVDFPLRTIAVSCLFAACAAIVANPRRDPVHVAVQT